MLPAESCWCWMQQLEGYSSSSQTLNNSVKFLHQFIFLHQIKWINIHYVFYNICWREVLFLERWDELAEDGCLFLQVNVKSLTITKEDLSNTNSWDWFLSTFIMKVPAFSHLRFTWNGKCCVLSLSSKLSSLFLCFNGHPSYHTTDFHKEQDNG